MVSVVSHMNGRVARIGFVFATLGAKKMQASKHRIPLKMAKNDAFSPKQSGLKTTSGEFLGMYELDFSCSSIFHQLWAHIGYF